MLDRIKRNVETGKRLAESENGSAGMDERAAMGAGGVIKLIVALTVGALVAAFLLPIAINELGGTDLTNASSGATALWDILDVMIVLAVFLFFTGIALSATNKV
jgi:hypothetical protein